MNDYRTREAIPMKIQFVFALLAAGWELYYETVFCPNNWEKINK